MADETVDSGHRQEAEGMSAAVEMRTVPAESAIRMREGQRSRRNPRIDGLGGLRELITVVWFNRVLQFCLRGHESRSHSRVYTY
jgi:hypothetical protein